MCGRTPEEEGRALAIDHDHTTGVVRGTLCHRCNKGIGLLQDSPELLQAGIEYLKTPLTFTPIPF